jgi:hypothetical protein
MESQPNDPHTLSHRSAAAVIGLRFTSFLECAPSMCWQQSRSWSDRFELSIVRTMKLPDTQHARCAFVVNVTVTNEES